MPAERLYYADSFLLEFPARVSDIREARREAGRPVWEMSLDRTAFYPTSGGQPADRGSLLARSASGAEVTVEVEDVHEDATGEIWHVTRKPLQAGTAVEARVDTARRTDHMQQHSGQHLLSACFLETAAWATVSFHLGAETSTIDLEVPGLKGLSADAVNAVAEQAALLANQRIFAALPVRVRGIPGEEARAMLADGRLRKLPERTGEVRIVEIAGVEHNACGGTHVRSTAQIGAVLLHGVERVRDTLRVEFCCGLRAVAEARRDFLALSAVARVLSVPRAATAEAARSLQDSAKNAGKEAAKLALEIARLEGAALAAATEQLSVREFPGRALVFLKAAAQRAAELSPGRMFLLWSREDGRANAVLSAGAGAGADAGAAFRAAAEALGGKGGGTPLLAQGSVPESRLHELLTQLAESLR